MSCKRLYLISMCIIAAGCVSVDPSRFFALAPLPRTDQRAQDTAGTNGLALAIGPIKFPGYLDRLGLVKRLSQNRFAVADNDLWAEPLEENFLRVLSQNLSILLQTDRIVVYPWERNQRPTYQVQVEVLRFEPNAEQVVELWARWIILDNAKKTVSVRESYLTHPARDKSTEASVASMSEVVSDLSKEITAAIRALIVGQGRKNASEARPIRRTDAEKTCMTGKKCEAEVKRPNPHSKDRYAKASGSGTILSAPMTTERLGRLPLATRSCYLLNQSHEERPSSSSVAVRCSPNLEAVV
jgi:uncharacterized lipoprotein YmbA